MRLFAVEARRLLARRLLRIMTALVFLALVFALAKTSYDSHPPTAAQRASAAAQAAAAADQQPPLAAQIKDCEQAKASGNGPPKDFDCKKAVHAPRAADFLRDTTFRFASQIPGRVVGFSVVLALLGFVIGASSVGAEWSAGTLPGLLMWEPRRIRVLVSKALALVAVLGGIGALVMAADIYGHYGVALARGDTTGVTHGLMLSTAYSGLRGVGLAVAAGLVGFAVAGTLRHTSAALGLGFGYFVGAELALRILWKGSAPWLVTTNVGAWLVNGLRVPVATSCASGPGNCPPREIHISMTHGAVYLGVLLAGTLLICAVSFRRRDVT